MIHHRHNTGFTLVEMIITMGLMAVFMLVLTDIVVAIGDVQNETAATSAVSQDGRYILARLSYDIERASSISTPSGLGGSGNSLVLVIGGVNQTYGITSGNFQLTNNLGTTNLNGNDTTVSNFSVTRRGNTGGKDTITLSFTVTGVAVQNSITQVKTYTTTVGRR